MPVRNSRTVRSISPGVTAMPTRARTNCDLGAFLCVVFAFVGFLVLMWIDLDDVDL